MESLSTPRRASAEPLNPSSSRSAHYAGLSGPMTVASHTHTLCRCAESASSRRTHALCVTEQLHVSQTELAYDKGHSGEENVCIAGVTCARILKADSLKATLSSPRHVPRGLKMKSVRELCSVFRNRVPGSNGQSSVTSFRGRLCHCYECEHHAVAVFV